MFEKIISIKKTKIKHSYDIEMLNVGFQGNRNVNKSNFIANNIVCKNSGGDARFSFSLSDTFDEFPEAKAFKIKYPEAAEIAVKLEGSIRHRGSHAAAIILTDKDVNEYVPIARVSDEIVTEWEKQLCEDFHLIKYDILGLKTLTVIDDAVKSSCCKLPEDFNDEKVYKNVFQKDNMLGVFQFEQAGIAKYTQMLNVKNFNELSDATSLYRPSALHSGQAMIYANRAQGKEKAEPFHPVLDELTKKTKGVIIYQEQIMKILYEVGKMSWSTSEMARKTITKSKGKDAMNKLRVEFVSNANKFSGMKIEEAEKLYDVVSTAGSYGFNESHATGYSILSYWTAWLKTYNPQHFYAALLKNESDKASIFSYIQDAKKNDVNIEFPDINKSDVTYKIIDDDIYAGFDSIISIGRKIADKIVKNQPYTDYFDFINKTKVSNKVLKGLIVSDVFRSFNINKKVCFDNDVKNINKFNPCDKFSKDFTDMEHTSLIYEFTKLKPRMDIRETFNFGNYDFKDISSLNENDGGKQVLIRGIVTDVLNKDKLIRGDIKEHIFKFEQHMIFLNVNDGTGDIACQINPSTYELYSNILDDIDRKPVIIMGILTKEGKKMYGDIIQVQNKTSDISTYFNNIKGLKSGEALISSAQPAVSKNKKSYYRILLNNGESGMCFRLKEKLYPGMKVRYNIDQKPFINIETIKQ